MQDDQPDYAKIAAQVAAVCEEMLAGAKTAAARGTETGGASCADQATADGAISATTRLQELANELGLAPEVAPLVAPPPAAPRVSVIVLAWNQLAHTQRCLAALRRTLPPGLAEIILVDNGSTDGTADWARSQADLQVIVNAENRGFGPANNQAAEMARGEYFLFLNNDTEPQIGWLEALMRTADADPKVGAVGARLVDQNGRLLEAGSVVNVDATCTNRGREAPGGTQSYAAPVEVAYASACALLVRRDAFQRIGGFDDRYAPAYYEDVDLCLALREAGHTVRVAPDACVVHAESVTARHLTGSESRRLRLQEEARVKFTAKWAGRMPAPPALGVEEGGDTVDGLAAVRAPLLPAPIRVAILVPEYHPDSLWGEAMVAAELREALEWRPDVSETRVFSYADAGNIDPFVPDLIFSLTAWRQPLRFRRGVTLFYVVNFTHERMPAGRFLTWDDALRMEADLYATNSVEGVARLGSHKPARLLQMAANPRLHRPLGVDPRYRAQVAYLGSYNVATKGREPFDRYIAPAAEFDLALWGAMWQDSPPALRRRWRGRLPVPHVARLYSSVDIALGFNAESQAAAGMINNRVFEVLACGALLVSDRVPAIVELFGDCAVFTEGYADTREKIAHYLAHPDERTALTRRARERILTGHTYDHRARDVVAMYADHMRERGRL